MATAPVALPPVDDHLWRMSVERYHEMIRAGLLTPDDRVELLEGVLVQQMSKNPKHVGSCAALLNQLASRIPSGWYIRCQEPITLTDSEPEPDLAVVRGSSGDYFFRHPGAAEVALVAEVADTLHRDRGSKKNVYASAGLPVYWLADLNGRVLEVYAKPRGGAYTSLTVLTEHDSVTLTVDGVALAPIRVADILPPVE